MWAAYSKPTSKVIPDPLNHCVIFIIHVCVQFGGWDRSVGKACCYGLCGPGFATPVWMRFLPPFRPTPTCTLHPLQRILMLLPGLKRLERGIDHPPRLMVRLRKRGRAPDLLLFPVCVVMAFYRVNFAFCVYINYEFGRGLRNTTWPATGWTHQGIRPYASEYLFLDLWRNVTHSESREPTTQWCSVVSGKKGVPSYTELPNIVVRL
jgi:hypothetical protein